MSFPVLRNLRALRRSEGGVALVELAVVLPFLAFLLIGVIETGRYMAFGIQLGNAAHAGAQYAAENETTAYQASDIASSACGDSGFSCTTTTPKPGHTAGPDTMFIDSSVSCSYSDGTSDSNCPKKSGVQRNMFVQVSTSGRFETLLHFPYLPASVPMAATATMQVGK